MKELNIDYKGEVFVVMIDSDDFDRVSALNWNIRKQTYPNAVKYYVGHSYKDKIKKSTRNIRLSNFIFGVPPKGMIVDHINGNTLDNRKCNLRFATLRQNVCNSRKRDNCSSKYKGVSKQKGRNTYNAEIRHYGEKIYLGSFRNEVDAALAYNYAAIRYQGEYARLNIIP